MVDIFLIISIVISVIFTVIIVLIIIATYHPTLATKCNTFVPSSKPVDFPAFDSKIPYNQGRSPVTKAERVLFLNSPLPTNHWMSGTFFSSDALIAPYPYLARITTQDYFIDIQGSTINTSDSVSIGMTGLLHFTFAEPVDNNWLT